MGEFQSLVESRNDLFTIKPNWRRDSEGRNLLFLIALLARHGA